MDSWRRTQRVELAGGRTVATDVLGEGPPVVLVHGTPTWSYAWRAIAPVLARTHAVHVYDLLGYGDSPAEGTADISVAAQARLLAELLDHWGLDRPAVAGHDIGGAILLRTHLVHQRPFARMALLDAVALAPWITPTTRHVQAHLEAYRTMPAHVFEQIVAAHLRTATFRPMSEEAFAAYWNRWRGTDGQAAYLHHVAQFDERHTAEFEAALPGVEPPVLLLWGERDAWLDVAVAHRLEQTIPTASLQLLHEAGHFCTEDAPAEVEAALTGFLAAG
jgi:pimeloyl-ACP methyl ester carboxylesterase